MHQHNLWGLTLGLGLAKFCLRRVEHEVESLTVRLGFAFNAWFRIQIVEDESSGIDFCWGWCLGLIAVKVC